MSSPDTDSSYTTSLRTRLETLRATGFINLGIASPYAGSLASLLRVRMITEQTHDIFSLYGETLSGPLVLVGEPGSGKTTLLVELALHLLASKEGTPIFQQVGMIADPDDWHALIPFPESETTGLASSFASGEAILLLDGIDEAQTEDLGGVFKATIKLYDHYPGARILLSCRTAMLPAWVHGYMRQVSILPIPEPIVRARLAPVADRLVALPPSVGKRCSAMLRRLHLLCRNPLLLDITLSVFDPSVFTPSAAPPRSKAELYELFLELLDIREQQKPSAEQRDSSLPSGLNRLVLEEVAFLMSSQGIAAVSRTQIENWVAAELPAASWQAFRSSQDDFTAQGIVDYLISHPPLRGLHASGGVASRFGFLHLSFLEHLAASRIRRLLDTGGWTGEHLDEFLSRSGRRHWEIASSLCGLSPGADTLRRTLALASRTRDQRLFVLGSRMLRDLWDAAEEQTDDLLLRILDAFKYWDIPFDYELMRAGRDLLDVSDIGLPPRLLEDLVYFADKYATVLPNDLGETRTSVLMDLVLGSDELTCIDAVYTLGLRTYATRPERAAAADVLLKKLADSIGIVREQVIAALKNIQDPRALPALHQVISEKSESPRARAYALNAVGLLGKPGSVEAVTAYMLDHSNPFRDSASWSLQYLAQATRSRNPSQFRLIKQTYLQALVDETDDANGRYARGNMLYSLGRLGAVEYLEPLLDFLQTTEDPYVLEDGIHTLGLLQAPESVPFALEHVLSPDPVVAMKAAEAVARLGARSSTGQLQPLLHHKYAIVRENAATAISALAPAWMERYTSALAALENVISTLRDDEESTIRVDPATLQTIREVSNALLSAGTIRVMPKIQQSDGFGIVTVTEDTLGALRTALKEKIGEL